MSKFCLGGKTYKKTFSRHSPKKNEGYIARTISLASPMHPGVLGNVRGGGRESFIKNRQKV